MKNSPIAQAELSSENPIVLKHLNIATYTIDDKEVLRLYKKITVYVMTILPFTRNYIICSFY